MPEIKEVVHGIALWALIACAAAVVLGLGAWAATTVRAHSTDSEQRRVRQ